MVWWEGAEKMTEKEAIREVVHDYRELRKVTDSDSARGIVINEAYAMAIQALDKQKSRQIITRDTRCPWHCPVCDADQSPAESIGGKLRNAEKITYCWNCGQKLSWGNFEEVGRMLEREIRFRGKTDDDGKWAEGSSIIQYPTKGMYIGEINPEAIDGEATMYRVLPETICEYTGLKDRDGTDIYENDIVVMPGCEENAVIEWDRDSAQWIMNNRVDGIIHSFDDVWYYTLQVVGNKFDDPELLPTRKG